MLMTLPYGLPTHSSEQKQCFAYSVLAHHLWWWLVPRRGDGSQYRHQLAATTKAILRISFTWTLVNAQFWSTQWSTQTFSHTWPHLHGPPPVATYIYTGRYTDWVQTMVTTISYLLWHLHGSLTCPPAMLHRHAVYGDYRVCDGGW